jgi:hypothetical protein
MFFPALAVLLERAAFELLGGNRSGEQSRDGDGGEGDGDLTHGVFSLALCRWHSLLWMFRIICLCKIYMDGNVFYARAPRRRSHFVNRLQNERKN